MARLSAARYQREVSQARQSQAYCCANLGANVFPCASTTIQGSRTSFQVWFCAIFLFFETRHGVSGDEPERALGVTYKTAWRMGQQIRKPKGEANGFNFEKRRVPAELDRAFVRGHLPGKEGRGAGGETIVFRGEKEQ